MELSVEGKGGAINAGRYLGGGTGETRETRERKNLTPLGLRFLRLGMLGERETTPADGRTGRFWNSRRLTGGRR